ncbi:MAG: efflux RND transporter periplasmic adaptor subunit [Candidatus Omnitrophica bacterium]|nr:efflux RND transporter periplasmic adaptor subunit [Candidatus Omnitrophota bacterium]
MKKLLIFLIIVGIGGYWQRDNLKKAFFKEEDPISVEEEIVYVKRGNMEIKILADGEVRPRNKVEVRASKAGRVEEILVDEGSEVKKGQVLAWISSEERIALLDVALARLEEAEKSDDSERIREAKRDWEIAEETYKKMPIVAPIDGTIIHRGIEVGQNISLDTNLFILTDVLVVVAKVDEIDIGKVEIGQPVRITVDAFPLDVVYGRVIKIAYNATVIDNVIYYDVTTDIEISKGKLKSGMTANVEIILKESKDTLFLPKRAIVKREEGNFVYCKKDANDELIPIKTGLDDDINIEVIEGLNEKDMVVIKSEAKLSTNPSKKKESKFKVEHLKYFRKSG